MGESVRGCESVGGCEPKREEKGGEAGRTEDTSETAVVEQDRHNAAVAYP